MRMSLRGLALPLAVIGAVSTACSSSGSSDASSASIAKGPLSGICPSTVVIQTDWFATAERAAAYQLVGPNGKIDSARDDHERHAERHDVDDRCLPDDRR